MKKFHLLLTLVALSLATTSLWALPTNVENGKLTHAFTVDNQGNKVYFSQGNLQYIGSASTPYWKFAEEQYEYFGQNGQGGTSAQNVDRDLFGYGTKDNPWNTSTNTADYSWHEWGELAISNGGNTENFGWRTLDPTEWPYLVNTRAMGNSVNGTLNARYTEAKILTDGTAPTKDICGLIIFPDDGNFGSVSGVTWGAINSPGKFDGTSPYCTTCTTAGWAALEAAGCVFLPASGVRSGINGVFSLGARGFYWKANSSSVLLTFGSGTVDPYTNLNSTYGASVRLVSNIPPILPAVITAVPTAKTNLKYLLNTPQTLINAGEAEGGTMLYSLDGTNWSAVLPQGTNATTYTVYYKVQGNGTTHKDFTPSPNTFDVTIAKANIVMPTINTDLIYNGSAQPLLDITGIVGGTIKYSVDGNEPWLPVCPSETEIGTYNVWYKVDAANDNYNSIPAKKVTVTIDIPYPSVAVNGKLPGMFSIGCGKYVYFSQGNLQYNKSNETWSFMKEQYSMVETTGQDVGADYANQDIVSLFGWGTSGWDNTAADPTSEHYQPYATCNTNHNTSGNSYKYGPSNANVKGGESYDWQSESWFKQIGGNRPYENYDWGVYNSGDLGAGWYTLTPDEWYWLLHNRVTTNNVNNYPNARFTLATINTDWTPVTGLILFPDDVVLTTVDGVTWGDFNKESEWTTSCTKVGWKTLEAVGCVFLPAAGYRRGTSVDGVGEYGYYWECKSRSYESAHHFTFNAPYGVHSGGNTYRYVGHSVRLVQDVDPADEPTMPTIYATSDPVGKTNMTYNTYNQTLLSSTAGAVYGSNGTVKYRLGTSGDWGTTSAYYTATNAGDYIVQWFVESTNLCYLSSDIQEIHVTIAKAPYTPTGLYSVTGNSLTYTGSAQDLVTATNSSNGTLQYSTDGGNTWSTTIPQGTEVGNYTVLYKVVPSNSNYEDYIPDPNTINVSIAKLPYTPTGDYSVTANDLTYDGSDQPLVSLTGSVEDGTVWYKLEPSGEWSTDIPTATNAGDYSVSYKVVPSNPNYEEYIPTPSNTINVNIAKADLTGVTLPASTSTIPYDGAEHTLLEVDPVADCVIWYKLGDGDWTTTPPTGTDAGDYSVQYKIVPNDAVNYNTIGPNTVTVTILDYPTVYDVNVDPTAKLSELLNSPSDLKVKRTIYADGEYNTICLPFSLDASALAASPLAGFDRLKTFRGAKVTGTAPDLSIDIFVEDATTIEAGIPYLMTYPVGDNIVDPVFHDVTVTTTTPSATSADGVTFQGMFAQVHIDPYASERDEDYLFLGANSQLVWPASSQTDSSIKMRGFRAYFIIDRNVITPALAPKGTRARIVDAPKTATGIYDASAKFGGSEKILENGILYIIRNGVRYNAQGQIVK